MDSTTLYYLAGGVLVAIGLAGTVLPVLPGTLLVFAGLFVAAWGDDFRHVGVAGLAIIAALGLLAFAADFFASLLGAKRVGASPQALVGAALGGVVGFFFGIAGMIVGPFVGAVGGELLAKGRLVQAGKVGIGTWLGLAAAAVLKVVLAFMMIATFVAFYVLNS